MCCALQDGVAYGDTFCRFVLFERTAVGSEDNSVVSGNDITIGDVHIAAAVDVYAIVVGDMDVGHDFQSANGHPVAVVYQISPSRRLVGHGHIFYHDILASCEEYDTRELLLLWEDALIGPDVVKPSLV